jgi:hypothetical protein
MITNGPFVLGAPLVLSSTGTTSTRLCIYSKGHKSIKTRLTCVLLHFVLILIMIVLSHRHVHTPHLFQRKAMFDIDRQLASALNISRRNKVRNEASDINIHLQQEARLRSLSNSETSNIRIENIPVTFWLEPRASLTDRPSAKQSQMYMQEEFTGIYYFCLFI